MTSRRNFLRLASATAGAMGSSALFGCTDGTGRASGRSAGSSETSKASSALAASDITASTRIYDIIDHPLLAGYGRLLFPTTFDPPTEGMTLADLPACLPWYSEIHVETTVDVVRWLLDRRAVGETVFYDIYTDEERAADPTLRDTGLFCFRAQGVDPGERRPFSIISAGGGFAYVAAMHDSFPHALSLARAGLNGFAVIYRPDAQRACEDLARAVAFVMARADELGVDPEGYSPWGGSAGARMAAWVGGCGPAAFGAPEDTPQPAAVIMQYTGLSELTGSDPATYACVGTRDGIASWRTMRARLDRLSAQGVPTEFHAYEGLRHGFGLGIGTVAEGWIDDARRFWLAQR